MLDITTKMEIKASSDAIFQAFVKSDRIGNFWFSRSSEDWEAGKIVELYFDEFDVHFPIEILEVRPSEKIVFSWGTTDNQRVVTLKFSENPSDLTTIVEVSEKGYQDFEDMLTEPGLSHILQQAHPEILSELMGSKAGWTYMLTCLKAYLENGVTSLRLGLIP
ncbi:MAG: SRPBCC domain-containing protein [Streptococcaceae bacterium]|jgi:uncharacterized protein YndB with AHSA1/START domain|nr:SRPBCC domain-containing protein [Streptococcaceae bacterium]